MVSVSLMQASFLRPLRSCLCCGGFDLEPLLDLGQHYLTDFLDAPVLDHPKAPLTLMLCNECLFAQLSHIVDRERLFRSYHYASGVNATIKKHLFDLANDLLVRLGLKASDIIVDIGANDGTFLRSFPGFMGQRVGFEPALNLKGAAEAGGNAIISEFFTKQAFLDRFGTGKRAKLVTALAMFYDLEHPVAFCQDVADILAPDGLFVVEMNYLGSILTQNAYDTIGHEHLGMYYLSTFNRVVRQAGMEVVDVSANSLNGGSFRLFCRKRPCVTSGNVDHFLNAESERRNRRAFLDFKLRATEHIATLKRWVAEAKERSKSIYAYGASTRGNTILQAAGLDKVSITAAIDKNPAKVGKVWAGLDIPIISEEAGRQALGNYWLVLPWGFIEEFKQREAAYLAAGGHMIVPLPEPKVVKA